MRIKIIHCKAPIAGNSEAIGKVAQAHPCARDIRTSMSTIGNAAVGDFKLIDAVHDLIRGSL